MRPFWGVRESLGKKLVAGKEGNCTFKVKTLNMGKIKCKVAAAISYHFLEVGGGS